VIDRARAASLPPVRPSSRIAGDRGRTVHGCRLALIGDVRRTTTTITEALTMKKTIHRKLDLRALTLRHLTTVTGGITIEPRPHSYGCPSVDTVSCLPPKSDGCYTQTM
jgi:hypothetical protein